MGHVLMSNQVPALTVPSAGIKAGDLAVGSSVYLMENGVAIEYLVVNQGIPSSSSLYDASCDGTWLMRKDLSETVTWDSTNDDYANSDVSSYLNGTFFKTLGSIEQNSIKQVKIPYRYGTGWNSTVYSGSSGLLTKIFLPSVYELGWTNSNVPSYYRYLPVDGAKFEYFASGTDTASNNLRISKYNGSAKRWMSRSPTTGDADKNTDKTNYVWYIGTNGGIGDVPYSSKYNIRPTLVLPVTAKFDETTLILKGVA